MKRSKRYLSIGTSLLLVLALGTFLAAYSASAGNITGDDLSVSSSSILKGNTVVSHSDVIISSSDVTDCENGVHSFGSWSYCDEEMHERTCSVCGKKEIAAHEGGVATHTDKAVCTVCGSEYGILLPVALKLDLATVTLEAGQELHLNLYKFPADSAESITWASSDTRYVTVDQDGTVAAVAKGKANITATSESGTVVKAVVSVVAPMKTHTSSIVINKPTAELVISGSKPAPTLSLSAKITGASTGKVWYSDNIDVVTVTTSGKLTAVSEGTANVYCRTADGTVSEPCVVTVKAFRINSDNMRKNVIYVNVGEEASFTLTDTVGYGAVVWSVSSAKVAAINGNKIAGLQKGTATLSVMTADKKVKDSCKLIVVDPSSGIKINKTSATLYEKQSVSLKVTTEVRGSNDPVFWTSSNSAVASVDANGRVTAKKQGTATITATTFNGETQTAVILVKSRATGVRLTGTPTYGMPMGGSTDTLTVEITSPANSNDSVLWKTSNAKVVAIISDPTQKTVTIQTGAKGTANITARFGGGKQLVWKVTSYNKAATSVTLNAYEGSVYVGKSMSFKIKTKLEKDSNDVVAWRSLDPSIATVDQNGKVTGIRQGEAVIDATTAGGLPNHVRVTVRTRAEGLRLVNKVSAIYFNNNTKTITVEPTAPTGCNDTIKWKTSNPKVIAIDSVSDDMRTVTIRSGIKGSATITATAGSGKKITFKVNSVDVRADNMTLNISSAGLYVGARVTIKAVKMMPSTSNDVPIFESSDPSVASVNDDGVVTALSQGDAVITVSAALEGVTPIEVPIKVRSKVTSLALNKSSQNIYVGEMTTVKIDAMVPAGSNDTITWTSSNTAIATVTPSVDKMSATVMGVKTGYATITVKTGSGKTANFKVTVKASGDNDGEWSWSDPILSR